MTDWIDRILITLSLAGILFAGVVIGLIIASHLF